MKVADLLPALQDHADFFESDLSKVAASAIEEKISNAKKLISDFNDLEKDDDEEEDIEEAIDQINAINSGIRAYRGEEEEEGEGEKGDKLPE